MHLLSMFEEMLYIRGWNKLVCLNTFFWVQFEFVPFSKMMHMCYLDFNEQPIECLQLIRLKRIYNF